VKFKKRRMVAGMLLLLLALGFHASGGITGDIGVPASLLGVAVLFALSVLSQRPQIQLNESDDTAEQYPLSRSIAKEVSEKTAKINIGVLGAQYRRDAWIGIESVVDGILATYVKIMRGRLDCHTIAVFFPTNDGGYRIRSFDSKSEFINREAVIYPGVGVLGSFIKDGLKQLHLHDIVTDSMTLYYYTRDAGIRSLIASPIMADDGVERGTVIVDSTEAKHFTDDDHEYLSTMARLIGGSVFYAYVYNEHRLEHERIAAMSTIEKDFFQNLDIDAILDRMIQIIPFAITCDRCTISLAQPDKKSITVNRAWGMRSAGLHNSTFSLSERSLVGLLYAKNMCFCRNYADDRYETRYGQSEEQAPELMSFLAFPIGVDECKGAVLLESTRKDAFTESNRDLLSRIATSAGLAIEKLQIFEQAKNLATHDGLTGLLNHREFQSVLKDEITRSIRYNDPLSLVLCDIDFFKKINDSYGHQFGDVVLKDIAMALKENIRVGVDIAARYGGEEFALILVKTDGANAVETVERIRQNIANKHFKAIHGEDLRVTLSFGIAVYGLHAKQLDALIQKADKALYRAKENGRNKVELF
jgi:diguanylate cyclase (GGDEF)-like protein